MPQGKSPVCSKKWPCARGSFPARRPRLPVRGRCEAIRRPTPSPARSKPGTSAPGRRTPRSSSVATACAVGSGRAASPRCGWPMTNGSIARWRSRSSRASVSSAGASSVRPEPRPGSHTRGSSRSTRRRSTTKAPIWSRSSCRGATLEELLAAGRLSDRDVVRIGIALCDALAHAHAHGVIHRDVKPSNVLVPEHPTTAAQLARLTDFGVARVLGGDSLTGTGDVIGTEAYMAPEQAQGLSAARARRPVLAGPRPVRGPERDQSAPERARRRAAPRRAPAAAASPAPRPPA